MDIKLTQFSHVGGFSCKIDPVVLSKIVVNDAVRKLPKVSLLGIKSSDDVVARYQSNNVQTIIALTDFFNPILYTPFDFCKNLANHGAN